MQASQPEEKQPDAPRRKLHTEASKFYDGAYGNARKACGITYPLPFCIVAVLRHGFMSEQEMEEIKNLFKELQSMASPQQPFFCHLDIYDNLAEIDKMRCKNAFQLQNGEIQFPTYAITIKNPDTGKYMGNTFQVGEKDMRKVFTEYFQQAAHHVATIYREKGDKPWWFDPIHEMQQIENPEEQDAREEARQQAYQDDTERKFRQAVAEGFNLDDYEPGEQVDELTRGMSKVLARDPKEAKMREIRRNLRAAIEIGAEEEAKFQIARASIKSKQADILKELMLVDTEDPKRAAFVEKVLGNMEKDTDAFVEQLKDQYVSAMNSIEKLRKLKGKKRNKMAKVVAKQVAAMKSAPMWMLGKGLNIGKSLWGEAQNMYYRSQSGAGVSYSGLMAAVLQEVMPNDPATAMFTTSQSLLNMASTLQAGANSISKNLMTMSLGTQITNQQFEIVQKLTAPGGIFAGEEAKKWITDQFGAASKSASWFQFGNSDNKFTTWLKSIADPKTGISQQDNQMTWFADKVKELKVPGVKAFEGEEAAGAVKSFYADCLSDDVRGNYADLSTAKEAAEKMKEGWWPSWDTASKYAGKAMLAYQMYDLTNQFISDVKYMIGMKNPSYTGLKQHALSAMIAIGSVFMFPAVTAGLAGLYGGTKLVGSGVKTTYMLLQFAVVKTSCSAMGSSSEGCEKVTKWMKAGEKWLNKQAPKISRYLLYAILGEKGVAAAVSAYYAGKIPAAYASYFSGNILTGLISGYASAASAATTQIMGLATAGLFTPVGVVAVGVLAIGGIVWYRNRGKKNAYKKTKKHLLRGGKILLPAGWNMWIHPQAMALWFAHSESGRIQNAFPTQTEFVDARGRSVADMTLEFGINHPTKKQEALARELAASIGDETRMRRALAMWVHSNPRPGAKLLAEQHLLKRIVGEDSFAELRQRKRLSAGGGHRNLRMLRVLSDGKSGYSKSILGLIGKHATYHDVRSLVLI